MKITGFMTTSEAAAYLKVSAGRVRQLVAAGTLTADRVNPQAVLVTEESVKRYETNRKPRGRKAAIKTA